MLALDWDSILAARGVIGAGVLVTLQVTLVAIAGVIVGGTGLAILAVSGNKALQLFARVYVALFQAVPFVTGRRPDRAASPIDMASVFPRAHRLWQFRRNGRSHDHPWPFRPGIPSLRSHANALAGQVRFMPLPKG